MSKARIPSWWIDVGGRTAQEMEDLFHRVMANLPMRHEDLAGRLGVAQSTVTRWSKGQATPAPEKMKAAVEEVRQELEEQLRRAAAAEEALTHLQAVIEASGADDGNEQHREVQSLREALEEWSQEAE